MSNKPRTLLDKWAPTNFDKTFVPISYNAFQNKRFAARKFVFSESVALTMADLLRDHPNLLIDNLQFALPPYEITYIEIPIGTFLDRVGKRADVSKAYIPGGLGFHEVSIKDKTAGYLIVGRTVHVLTETDDGKLALSPMVYKMHFEGTDETVGFKGIQRIHITSKPDKDSPDPEVPNEYMEAVLNPDDMEEDEFWTIGQLLGSTLTNPKFELTNEQAEFLKLNTVCVDQMAMKLYSNNEEDKQHGLQTMLEGSIGEVRNILLCLLWLNQPKLIDIETVPATRGWFKGKNRAYSAYSLVSLKKEVTVRRALGTFREHSRHRRHEVQAYFRNFDKHEGCEHDWPLYPDNQGRWTCPKCGQWRVRVKEHVRGDASLGWVNKDYLVR